MRDFLQLPLNCAVDSRMIVPVKVGPNGRIGIEVFASFAVAQHGAPPLDNDNRLASQPIPHLSERVPNVAVIQLSNSFHVWRRRAESNCSMSAAECAAVTLRRRRAWPRA